MNKCLQRLPYADALRTVMCYILCMKLICAPMATLSHPAFRFIIEKFGGCDEYYTEMINAPTLIHGGQFEKFYIDPAPVPEKIVWQLTGKTAEPIVQAADIVCRIGGIGVDLNMGCSAPDIYNSGAGIAWMLKSRGETEALVRGVKSVLNRYEAESGIYRRLSVKCRLGDENYTDEGFFNFIDMLVECGAEQIALHPRTRKEKYREKPRWIYAQKIAEKYPEISVIVNGDVCDKSSYNKVCEVCPSCAGVMVGRAAVQKPWIFASLKNSADSAGITVDLLSAGLEFIDYVEKYQPPEFYRTRLQRFFTYYCANLSFAHYARTELLNAKSVEESRMKLTEYFEKVPADRYKTV